jgi:hypothetical protein
MLPSTCSKKSQYRTLFGCRDCVRTGSPFRRVLAGRVCYNPTTLSAKSTKCTPLVLPLSVTGGCINSRRSTVSVRLPTRTSQIKGFSASSYLKLSLRLAGSIVPRRDPRAPGRVLFIRSGTRRIVQFVDKFGVLRRQRGKTVQVTGIIQRGSLKAYCFTSFLRVCR